MNAGAPDGIHASRRNQRGARPEGRRPAWGSPEGLLLFTRFPLCVPCVPVEAVGRWDVAVRNHRPGSLRRMASMRSQMALAAASGSIPA